VGVLYSGRPPSRLADGAEGRANPAIVEFTLPVTARGVDFDIHPRALSDRLARVELRPAGVIPRSHRAGAGIPRSMLPIAGWPGGFVCFLDTNSYPEPGLSWVRGGRSASILVVPAGASLIRVTLHAGAVGTPVSVTSPGQHTRLDLDAHGRGEAYVPVPDDARAVALDVSAAGGFRPADLGIGSADRRYLGVRFGIELLE
jgi:hypothetical protein